MKGIPTIVLVVTAVAILLIMLAVILLAMSRGYNAAAFITCVVLGIPFVWIMDEIRQRTE